MKYILLSALLAFSLSCPSWAGESEAAPVEAPAPAVTAEVPEAVSVVPATDTSPEAAPAADSAPSEGEAAEGEKGFVDKTVGVLNSIEALLGAIIGVLVALGVAVPLINKLRTAQKAIRGMANQVEKVAVNHIEASKKLKKDIAEAHPEDTPVGAVIHAAAKAAENGG